MTSTDTSLVVERAVESLLPLTDSQRDLVECQARATVLSVALGGSERLPTVNGLIDIGARSGLAQDISACVAAGTLAAAADLDVLDVGPAHLSLPATVAAAQVSASGRAAREVVEAVAVGIEVGARFRRCVGGVRPGVGFHSAGVYGTIAAAAAAGWAVGLDVAELGHAVAIALTRSGGLSTNNASTAIGLTHFGWASGHGLEAACLAADGWTAHGEIESALSLLAPGSDVEVGTALGTSVEGVREDRCAFKWYPCNIYLNLVCRSLDELGTAYPGLSRVRVVLPPVRHLGKPASDLRQARNSAQASVAMYLVGGGNSGGYEAFQGWPHDAGVDVQERRRRVLEITTVEFDEGLDTDLRSASCVVDVVDADGPRTLRADMSLLGPWGLERAVHLGRSVLGEDLVRLLWSAPVDEAYATACRRALNTEVAHT